MSTAVIIAALTLCAVAAAAAPAGWGQSSFDAAQSRRTPLLTPAGNRTLHSRCHVDIDFASPTGLGVVSADNINYQPFLYQLNATSGYFQLRLVAFDPTTCGILWTRAMQDWNTTNNPPSFPSGFGSHALSGDGAVLVHVDLTGDVVGVDPKTGDQLWQFNAQACSGGLQTPLMVVGGSVYGMCFPSDAQFLVGIDVQSGVMSANITISLSAPATAGTAVLGAATVDRESGNPVFYLTAWVAATMTQQYVFALTHDGTTSWSTVIPKCIGGSFGYSMLLAEDSDTVLVWTNGDCANTLDGGINALNTQTGAYLWSYVPFSAPGFIQSVALTQPMLPADDGDAQDTKSDAAAISHVILTLLIMDSSTLVDYATLRCVDPTTGQVRWLWTSPTPPSPPPSHSSRPSYVKPKQLGDENVALASIFVDASNTVTLAYPTSYSHSVYITVLDAAARVQPVPVLWSWEVTVPNYGYTLWIDFSLTPGSDGTLWLVGGSPSVLLISPVMPAKKAAGGGGSPKKKKATFLQKQNRAAAKAKTKAITAAAATSGSDSDAETSTSATTAGGTAAPTSGAGDGVNESMRSRLRRCVMDGLAGGIPVRPLIEIILQFIGTPLAVVTIARSGHAAANVLTPHGCVIWTPKSVLPKSKSDAKSAPASALSPEPVLIFANCGTHDIRQISALESPSPVMTQVTAASDLPGISQYGCSVAESRYVYPTGVCVDPSTNAIYVTQHHCVRRMTLPASADGRGEVRLIAGGGRGFRDGVGASALFTEPAGLVCTRDGRTLYVLDFGNYRVRSVAVHATAALNHVVTSLAGQDTGGDSDGIGGAAQLDCPVSIVWDPQSDETACYIAATNSIRRFNIQNNEITTLYLSGHKSRVFSAQALCIAGPTTLIASTSDGLFTIDLVARRVHPMLVVSDDERLATRDGRVLNNVAGLALVRGSGGGTANGDDRLYCSDAHNNRVRCLIGSIATI